MSSLGRYELRRMLVLELLAVQEADGRIPQRLVAATATAAGTSIRSVWSWVAAGGPPEPVGERWSP